MRYALTAEAMRAAEDAAVANGATTITELMERAGAALASEIGQRWPTGTIVVVCGPGNNGGDGWVAARLLEEAGRQVEVLAIREPDELRAEAARAAASAIAAGVRWHGVSSVPAVVETTLAKAVVVVDAVFGFGFRGPARDTCARVLKAIDACEAPVLSADVPSGVDSDTGAVTAPAVHADLTVTFNALKPGLLVFPGEGHAGEVVVADLGIDATLLQRPDAVMVPESADLAGLLPRPLPEDHKGSRGRVAIVAGSAEYPGAAVLAARGALRMGAGYVFLVVPDAIADIARSALPSAIVRAVPSGPDGCLGSADAVLAAVADADAVVAGPGLGRTPAVGATVRALVAGLSAPLLLDADALNALSGDRAMLDGRPGPTLLTPHPGEMARLLGVDIDEVHADRLGASHRAATHGVTCLLKGPRTVVADADRRALVTTGGPELARAGTGDVLSGICGTLLAQGLGPFDAGLLGAFVHGMAGEHAATRLTSTCVTSSDIPEHLPDAIRSLLGGNE
ncbi:MAG: NAD(P)H-hydrate dehydratase [Aeromicrobium sp.]|nr:NAD(P)H-hydrate dehydratase [Aeromicrobium sp.]